MNGPRQGLACALLLASATLAMGQVERALDFSQLYSGGGTWLRIVPAHPTTHTGPRQLVVEFSGLLGGPYYGTLACEGSQAEGELIAPASMKDALGAAESRALRLSFEEGKVLAGTLTICRSDGSTETHALELERRNCLPIDEDYQEKPAAEKLQILWEVVQEHPYDPLAYPTLGSQEALNDTRKALSKDVLGRKVADLRAAVASRDVSQFLTFTSTADVRAPRWRLRHPFGSVARVVLEPTEGSPYTGMFSQASEGLLRLSLNVDSDEKHNPGLALKLFVDGEPSVNIVASTFFDPREDRRTLLEHTLFNWNEQGIQTLDHVACVLPDGSAVSSPSAPAQLHFVPRALPRWEGEDFRDALTRLEYGVELYGLVDGQGTELATLRLTSLFVASDGGDRLLHTSHVGFRPHAATKLEDRWQRLRERLNDRLGE